MNSNISSSEEHEPLRSHCLRQSGNLAVNPAVLKDIICRAASGNVT